MANNSKAGKFAKTEGMWGYIMVAPTIIGLIVLNLYPFIETILMITHNNSLTSMVDRVLRVTDGVLTDLGGNANEKLS